MKDRGKKRFQGVQIVFCRREIVPDIGQGGVELMGDARRQLPDRGQFLRLENLSLGVLHGLDLGGHLFFQFFCQLSVAYLRFLKFLVLLLQGFIIAVYRLQMEFRGHMVPYGFLQHEKEYFGAPL